MSFKRSPARLAGPRRSSRVPARLMGYPLIPPGRDVDRAWYERECGDATWRFLNGPPWGDARFGGAAWPIAYWIEGVYPDTCVVVEMGYLNRRSPREHRYPIWKGHHDHGVPDDGSMPTPELFGVNVAGWIIES